MHTVIYAIVYAEDEDEALEKGKEIFEQLVEETIFDYYTTFDDDTSTVSGKARWGDLPPVISAIHPDGIEMIDGAMEQTWKEFKENISTIRKLLEKYTDEEIFEEATSDGEKGSEETYINMARHYFYEVGRYKGPSVYLYDNDGEGIRDKRHLRNVLNKWSNQYEDKENPYKDLGVYIVPADVHY